jgi:hypothetical protein
MAVIWLILLNFPLRACGATVTYTGDSSSFKNPERGLYVALYYYGPGHSSNQNMDGPTFQHAVNVNPTGDKQITLVQRVFSLAAYNSQPYDATVLGQVAADFASARSLGIKLIPRFDYNEGPIGAADAAQSVIMNHLDQLAPLLQANEDVIAYVEAGFIGTWGEWHDSTNGLTDPLNNNSTTPELQILNKLLSVLPSDRMVAQRYPGYTQQIFSSTTALTAAQAFNGTAYARMGTHDDCFEVDSQDGGTYAKGGVTITGAKDFLHAQNLYVPEGGESCGVSSYSNCANTVADLSYMHWSALHAEYEPNVIAGWVSGGCMPQIATGLGYRFRLISSDMPLAVTQGGSLALTLQIANDGFASCYNPRAFEIILRPSGQPGAGSALVVSPSASANTDPRFWQSGLSLTASLNLALPMSLGSGTYDVFLNLPDPMPSLHDNPAYSIRLANSGVWEAATGYNKLGQSLAIDACTGCAKSTPTPGPAGPPADLISAMAVPNPNPDVIAFNLAGNAQALDLGIYSAGMICVAKLRLQGSWLPGWNHASIPSSSSLALANGHYYFLARAEQGGSQGTPKSGSFVVLR